MQIVANIKFANFAGNQACQDLAILVSRCVHSLPGYLIVSCVMSHQGEHCTHSEGIVPSAEPRSGQTQCLASEPRLVNLALPC